MIQYVPERKQFDAGMKHVFLDRSCIGQNEILQAHGYTHRLEHMGLWRWGMICLQVRVTVHQLDWFDADEIARI
jgi:hypothetical protein